MAETAFADFTTLLVEEPAPHVLRLTLNRPEVGNAKNTEMGLELLAFWSALERDSGEARCVVLTGAGAKIFCAGGDLKQRNTMTDKQWEAQHVVFELARDKQLACPLPVIGAINGHAYGGGCEMALCCDFVYAAKTARFALPEVTRGIMPGNGGTQLLPRAIGERRAKEIVMTGKPFTADQAADWGLVNEVCEADALMPRVLETAAAIAANAPLSIRQAKKSIRHGLEMNLADGLMFELEAYGKLVRSEDRLEGVSAFNEKRAPVFRGR